MDVVDIVQHAKKNPAFRMSIAARHMLSADWTNMLTSGNVPRGAAEAAQTTLALVS